MKNIRILTTDKPSRLVNYLMDNSWDLFSNPMPKVKNVVCQNIYITSDEEIKGGDYFIRDGWIHKCFRVHKTDIEFLTSIDSVYCGSNTFWSKEFCQKIILTTDQDLIKEGVQAIDDEFLEWFVKNPSCENVETIIVSTWCNDGKVCVCNVPKFCNEKRNGFKYKIIIPKEEQKELRRKLFTLIKSLEQEEPKEEPTQESVFEKAKSSLKKYLFDNKEKVATYLEQMREWSNTNKQDPLEEAAKEYSERHLDVSGNLGKYLVKAVFQDGGKWGQEKSYSELVDLLERLTPIYREDSDLHQKYDGQRLELIEKFKKK